MATNVATVLDGACDPKDVKDYVAQFDDLLDDGETIAAGTFTVTPSAEAIALGVGVMSDPAPAIVESGKSIQFWPEVDAGYYENAAFDRRGITLAFEIEFSTSSSPQRTYQRTFTITFKQL